MVRGLIAATLIGHITCVQSTVCCSEVVHCQWISLHTIVAAGVSHQYEGGWSRNEFPKMPLGDANSWIGSVDAWQSYVGADFLLRLTSLGRNDGRACQWSEKDKIIDSGTSQETNKNITVRPSNSQHTIRYKQHIWSSQIDICTTPLRPDNTYGKIIGKGSSFQGENTINTIFPWLLPRGTIN